MEPTGGRTSLGPRRLRSCADSEHPPRAATEERHRLLRISHDLGAVERIADRIAVIDLSKIVEEADAGRAMESPLHPYTQALL